MDVKKVVCPRKSPGAHCYFRILLALLVGYLHIGVQCQISNTALHSYTSVSLIRYLRLTTSLQFHIADDPVILVADAFQCLPSFMGTSGSQEFCEAVGYSSVSGRYCEALCV